MASQPDPATRQRNLADLLSRVALGHQASFDQLYRETSAHLLGAVSYTHLRAHET